MGSKAVAVKIMTRSAAAVGDLKYEEELQRSYDEAKRTVQIRKSGGPSLADLVIEVYGFAQGDRKKRPLSALATYIYPL